MLRLIQFEAIKAFKSMFFKVILLAFTIFIIAYYAYVYMNTTRVEDLLTESEDSLFRVQSELEELEASVASGKFDKESREYKNRKSDLEDFWLPMYSKEVEAYRAEDYNRMLDMEIEHRARFFLPRLAEGDFWSREWRTLFTEQTSYEQLKLLREREIRPLLPLTMFSDLTVYDQYFGEDGWDKFIKKMSTKYSSEGVHYANRLLTLLFSVFGAGIFIFLFGDVVTREGLGANGPVHLLRTQPIRWYQVIISKFIMVLGGTLLLLALFSGLALLLGTVFDRFGELNYPVLIYGEANGFTFMEMSTFILKSGALFFLVLVFCYSLLFLFSLVVRKTAIAVGLMLIILFAGVKMSEQSVASPWAPYQPFQYFAVPKVVTNELAVMAKNFAFSFSNGLIALGVASVVVWMAIAVVSVVQYRFAR
ncbi:hypothetical protein AB1K89_13465 [Sporosarcina sp. 179-K 8C2 HS]|uniref:hypothetical protein n=1 Tax=Sporosarcina sp. 179-K 8C2 HS TaxID=3142387 RepID=UPI00399EF8EC